jgi:hypothetical protein
MQVPHPYGRTIAGPAAGNDLVMAVASGFQNQGYTVAIKTRGEGDVTSTHKAWSFNKFLRPILTSHANGLPSADLEQR